MQNALKRSTYLTNLYSKTGKLLLQMRCNFYFRMSLNVLKRPGTCLTPMNSFNICQTQYVYRQCRFDIILKQNNRPLLHLIDNFHWKMPKRDQPVRYDRSLRRKEKKFCPLAHYRALIICSN